MELLDVVDENNNLTGKVEDTDENYTFSKRDISNIIEYLYRERSN